MNFPPNPANAAMLAGGRVQQQQQQQQLHQVPVTSSSNMQKSGNLPGATFPMNPQLAGVDSKLPPSSHHPSQQAAQNNNHNMGGIPQQPMMNRSQGQQLQQQQQQHHQLMMGDNSKGGRPQMESSIFQQLQQMAQRQLHQQQRTNHQSPQQTLMGHQIKPNPAPQQQLQMKQLSNPIPQQQQLQTKQLVTSYHNPQNSPPKPMHPQMKTTAKLSSPGSQLQTIQKSPTLAPQPPNPMGQIAALATAKNVPSSSPPMTSSPPKAQPQAPAVRTPPPAVAQTVPSANTPAVKPTPTSATPQVEQTIPKPVVDQASAVKAPIGQPATNSSIAESAPTKVATEPLQQPKETSQTSNKPVPKPEEEIKELSVGPQQSSANAETNNKVEKSPVSSAVPQAPIVKPSSVVATTPSKNTMRLATVTPRQKKPPPTKKPLVSPAPSPATSPNAAKTPAKAPPASPTALVAPAKTVETPKTPTSTKRTAAATPKTVPGASGAAISTTTPKSKRSRVKVQPYQSPTPELALVTKLSTQIANSSKNGDENKLTIFYKSEFLAVRNGEGGFYLCQAMQNVYKSSPKIRIRWLNEKDEGKMNASGSRSYNLDFYDLTDFECVLTTVELDKVGTKTFELPKEELMRIENILKKAIDVEKGILPRPTVTEENPDGLDLSLYKDEAQLEKPSSSRKRGRGEKSEEDEETGDDDYEELPKKKQQIVKKAPVSKRAAATKKPVVDDYSSESDEENLMELKKKAKKAIATPKAAEKSAPEPIPSTSKASISSPVGRGRKRFANQAESEVPEKVAKVESVKESPASKAAPTPKTKTPTVARGKPGKKSSPEKSSPPAPAEKTPVVSEKKPAAEKKALAGKKAPPADEKVIEVKSPAASPTKTPPVAKAASPAKKSPATKAKPSPAASPSADQEPATPTTSRSRNTRSKK